MAGKLLFPRSKIKNLITGNKKIKCEHAQILFTDERYLENSKDDELKDLSFLGDKNTFPPKDTS